MNELKQQIVALLQQGPRTVNDIVAAFPDAQMLTIGKALSSLAKEDRVAWGENSTVALIQQ
jgi:hypothetical protein